MKTSKTPFHIRQKRKKRTPKRTQIAPIKSHSEQPQQFAIRAQTGSTYCSSYPGTVLPCLPSPFANPVFRTLSTAVGGGLAVVPPQCCLMLVPPGHEAFGCFEDPPVLAAFFAAIFHSAVSTPNTNEECSMDPSVARNTRVDIVN